MQSNRARFLYLFYTDHTVGITIEIKLPGAFNGISLIMTKAPRVVNHHEEVLRRDLDIRDLELRRLRRFQEWWHHHHLLYQIRTRAEGDLVLDVIRVSKVFVKADYFDWVDNSIA